MNNSPLLSRILLVQRIDLQEEILHGLTMSRHLLAGVLLLVFATSAVAEVCPNPQVPKAEREQADQLLLLSETEQADAIQTHLPFGTPACPKLFPEREYILCYDPVARIGLWAGYRLRAEDVIPAQRRNAFRTDPRLTDQETAHCADYPGQGSGYDRGHIVPRDDMNRTSAVQTNTYLLSNMTPQASLLNEGIWAWLEGLVRAYAKTYGEVLVITGSIVQPPVRTVPSGNVAIPTRYYKMLLRTRSDGTLEALTIVLPNLQRGLPLPPGSFLSGPKLSPAEADTFLAGHTASIREVETLTGVDLLPNLTAEPLKRAVASELWPRN
jgi:endonuclease G